MNNNFVWLSIVWLVFFFAGGFAVSKRVMFWCVMNKSIHCHLY